MRTPTRILLTALCLALPALAAANLQRLERWGQGASEFEAVKSAYKLVLADALKLTTAGAGTLEGSLRRRMERDFEESFLQTRQTFFPESDERCERERYTVECLVVVAVRMDELEARVRSLLAETGADGWRVTDLGIALMGRADSAEAEDFVSWLHSELEGDFGHDVYLSRTYVEPAELGSGCAGYRRLLDEYAQRGSRYEKTASGYRTALRGCEALLERDIVIVLDGIDIGYESYSTRNASMAGMVRLGLKFLRTGSGDPLPAPRPRSITQYGHGESEALARAGLRDNLFEASANYISQQFNDTVVHLTQQENDPMPGGTGGEYYVTVTGITTDTREDRERLSFVRQWFADHTGYELARDYQRGGFAEQVHTFSATAAVNWAPIVDGLYEGLDGHGYEARIDVDRNTNLTVAFTSETAPKADAVTIELNHRQLRRRIDVEGADLVLHRRDPATGIAITLNEANVRIRSKARRDMVITANPVWYTSSGSVEPAPFSDERHLLLKDRSEALLVFRAPSKHAQRVVLEISCPEDECEVR